MGGVEVAIVNEQDIVEANRCCSGYRGYLARLMIAFAAGCSSVRSTNKNFFIAIIRRFVLRSVEPWEAGLKDVRSSMWHSQNRL
jgi:hypothetical protein